MGIRLLKIYALVQRLFLQLFSLSFYLLKQLVHLLSIFVVCNKSSVHFWGQILPPHS